jgi:threonine/homoserine/homoserine lactone efflux protein
VRWVGALYLLYLAWTTFRSAGGGVSAQRAVSALSLSAIFWQGFVTNLLNPKVALFVLALFPQFVEPASGPVALQIMVLATVLNLIGLIVNGAVILAASHARTYFVGGGRLSYVPHYFLSAVFAGLAFRLALADRD